MKQISTIAIHTFLQPFRKKYAWLFIAFTAGIGLFVFIISRSDGELINELRLKIRFGLTASVTFTFLITLWQSCISMCGDISGKRIHVITSYPIKRSKIYLGKWLGLVAYGFIAIVVSSITIFVVAYGTYLRCDDDEMKLIAKNELWTRQRSVAPISNNPETLAKKIYNENLLKGQYAIKHDPVKEILNLRAKIMKVQRLVGKNGKKLWEFDVSGCPMIGKSVYLKYRFFTRNETPVKCVWLIGGESMIDPIRFERNDRPYINHVISIPISKLSDKKKLLVEFHAYDNPQLLFYRHMGMEMRWQDGTWLGNLPRYFLFLLAHLSVIVAAGLTIATAFTISVATFVSSIVYAVAMGSEFFLKIVKEIRLENDGIMRIGGYFTRVALFPVTGMEIPDVITPFSNSISITFSNVGMEVTRQTGALLLSPIRVFSVDAYKAVIAYGGSLTIGYIVYMTLVMGGGIWLLSRKELDKLR